LAVSLPFDACGQRLLKSLCTSKPADALANQQKTPRD